MKRPVAYVVKQKGLSEYTEMFATKKQAMAAAREMLWWSKQVTIQPLYAGKKLSLKW